MSMSSESYLTSLCLLLVLQRSRLRKGDVRILAQEYWGVELLLLSFCNGLEILEFSAHIISTTLQKENYAHFTTEETELKQDLEACARL